MPDSNGPIFVVGSPRSGTSILTWSLGQHPNIMPLEESGWLGKFSADLVASYDLGTARGERSALSAMQVARSSFYQSFGEAINKLLIGHRASFEAAALEEGKRDPSRLNAAFKISRDPAEPKHRWIDGTPEYSFFISGLRRLFPDAKFLHIVRDVDAVVRSMLQFERWTGSALVDSEQTAYEYWFRTVSDCLQAERAYGSDVVMRIRYENLVAATETTLRSCTDFVGEVFSPHCMACMQTRINSSHLPAGDSPPAQGEQDTNHDLDPDLLNRARLLSQQLSVGDNRTTRYPADPAAALAFESYFDRRARYLGRLDTKMQNTLRLLAAAERELATLREMTLYERVREVVRTWVPYDATVAVVSRGDSDLLNLMDREAWHFPRDQAGAYAGHHPAESAAAISHLEAVREQGADYLLVPQPSLWWLEYYAVFAEHLNRRYRRIWAREDTGVLYELASQ